MELGQMHSFGLEKRRDRVQRAISFHIQKNTPAGMGNFIAFFIIVWNHQFIFRNITIATHAVNTVIMLSKIVRHVTRLMNIHESCQSVYNACSTCQGEYYKLLQQWDMRIFMAFVETFSSSKPFAINAQIICYGYCFMRTIVNCKLQTLPVHKGFYRIFPNLQYQSIGLEWKFGCTWLAPGDTTQL